MIPSAQLTIEPVLLLQNSSRIFKPGFKITKHMKSISSKKTSISGIILAAGSAERMGTLKQLLDVKGKPMLQWVYESACLSDLDQVIVVLGHEKEKILQTIGFPQATVVYNPNYRSGLSTSLKIGLETIPDEHKCAVFILGDQPLVNQHIINRLIEAYLKSQAPIVIPAVEGKKGNPVLMDRSVFSRLMALSGDIGGRVLFDEFKDRLITVDLADTAIHMDIDTIQDYRNLIKSKNLTDIT